MNDVIAVTGEKGREAEITVKAIEAAAGLRAQPHQLNRLTVGQWIAQGELLWANFPRYSETIRAYLAECYEAGPDAVSEAMVNELVNWRGTLLVASTQARDSYGGLDIKGVNMPAYDLAEFMPGLKYLTQEAFNFLTLQDVTGPKHRGLYLQGTQGPDISEEVSLLETAKDSNVYEPLPYKMVEAEVSGDPREISLQALIDRYRAGAEANALTRAFTAQLIAEAEPHRGRVVTGAYILDRVSFPQLDSYIAYDNLRLVIVPRGIFFTIVKQAEAGAFYTCGYWAPDSPPVTLDPVLFPMISVIMAGIWRDACVVREKWYTERTRQNNHYSKSQLRRKVGPLILPRVISRVAWASDSERQAITHALHTVRGHYRRLAEGWKRGENAGETARYYGYPEPPDGYTFVIPHNRGSGLVEANSGAAARKVICRGLMSVKVSLS